MSTEDRFCTANGLKHEAIQSKIPNAICCPHCGLKFKARQLIDLTADTNHNEVIDLPSSSPPRRRARRPEGHSDRRPDRHQDHRQRSATTIPLSRTTSMPGGYDRATRDAMASRKESIENTRSRDRLSIHIQGVFYAGSGVYEMIGDIETIEFQKAPKLVDWTQGAIKEDDLVFSINHQFESHKAMIAYIVKELRGKQSVHEWEVVHNVALSGPITGPARLPERAYSTISIQDLMSYISIDPQRELRGPRILLTFWKFFEVLLSEMPSRSRAKRNLDLSDADSEACTPSPRKRKTSHARLPTVKEEQRILKIKLERVKKEPTTRVKKEHIKEERLKDERLEDEQLEDERLEDDPFDEGNELSDLASIADLAPAAGSHKDNNDNLLWGEEITVGGSPSKRQSGRVSKKSWKTLQQE
ncbi:uncharacterized protein AUP68_10588 [Ilyonectria robusta]